MKKYLAENKAFLLPYLVFLILLLPVILVIPKGDLHLAINARNSSFFDYFFAITTWFGDGIAPVILSVILAVFSFRRGLIILLSGTIAGLVAQFFKRVVFPDMARPAKYFEGIAELHFVEGVDIHHSFTFPSGHSATAFALCLSLAFMTGNKFLKFILFLMALLIAFSRVYLSQHFVNDIYAGSVIGVVFAILFTLFVGNSQKKWLDLSFKKLIFRS